MNAVIIYSHKNDKSAGVLAEHLAKLDGFRVLIVGHVSKVKCAADVLRLKCDRRGMGAAIKQGFSYIKEKIADCKVVTTITDAVRYEPAEVVKICHQAMEHPGTLVIGTAAEDVGRVRGWIEKVMFSLATGQGLSDIHTSLRAFSSEMISKFIHIATDSAAYEIEMLMQAIREGVSVREVDVKAKKHPVKYGWQKLRSVYISAMLFLASSIFAFVLEFALLIWIEAICEPMGQALSLAMAVSISRIISCIVNYLVNRKLVFKSSSPVGSSVVRYFLLAAFILVVNYLILRLCVMVFMWPLWVSKIIVESILFFVNFALQGKFVYRH